MSTLDPHFLAKPGFVEQNGAHFWLICHSTSWLAEIDLNFFCTHKFRNPDFSWIRNKSGIRILWVQKKLRPISASQDVLRQMSQKWAPFCSTKPGLARKWGSKVLISIWDQNILKFFYPKKLNWVMFWFMLARKKNFCYIKLPPNMLLQWLGFLWSTLYTTYDCCNFFYVLSVFPIQKHPGDWYPVIEIDNCLSRPVIE